MPLLTARNHFGMNSFCQANVPCNGRMSGKRDWGQRFVHLAYLSIFVVRFNHLVT
jgi:hypothetical protein